MSTTRPDTRKVKPIPMPYVPIQSFFLAEPVDDSDCCHDSEPVTIIDNH